MIDRVFDLLQHGVGDAVREVVARQQQDRQPVDRRASRAGDHVRRAGSDRRGAGERLQSILVLGVGGGEVDLGLLVLGPIERHPAGGAELFEGLPQTGHVAVPEDPPDTGDEAVLDAIPLHVLLRHETDDGLSDREADGGHSLLLSTVDRAGSRRHHEGASRMLTPRPRIG